MTNTERFDDVFEGMLHSFVDPDKHDHLKKLLDKALKEQYQWGRQDGSRDEYQYFISHIL